MLLLGPFISEWPTLSPRVMVLSGLRLLQRTISGSVALLQPQSVLMYMVPITTADSEDRAAQSCSYPSLAATVGRTDPAPYLGSTMELASLAGLLGEPALKAWEWESCLSCSDVGEEEMPWLILLTPHPCYLLQAGKMILGLQERESWPYPSLTGALRRVALHLTWVAE